jgi:hypothetical protein
MEGSWNRKLCSAFIKLAPMTNARDGASWYSKGYFARLFVKFVCWWAVFALATTMLGGLDLNPVPGPENVVVPSIGAVLAALSPLGPLAHCINWARLRVLWQARFTASNHLR